MRLALSLGCLGYLLLLKVYGETQGGRKASDEQMTNRGCLRIGKTSQTRWSHTDIHSIEWCKTAVKWQLCHQNLVDNLDAAAVRERADGSICAEWKLPWRCCQIFQATAARLSGPVMERRGFALSHCSGGNPRAVV